MNSMETRPADHERFEYHGSTIVERIKRYRDEMPTRDWILFDTIEEAQAFYNENRAG